ncbi:MAG TPA: HAMP domain-containing sensor histidine kinase [Phycisphaerae bacterium]|nr:HAMP domain-containing sensor histidine kinase [Phycisphaerae bacterium]
MSSEIPDNMATYELPPLSAGPPPQAIQRDPASLTEPLLVGNVVWFCRLRWAVTGILATFGVLADFPPVADTLRLARAGPWPFAIAGILAAYNLVFLAHARVLRRPHRPFAATANLACQIVLDLVVLTAVVHFAGSRETLISFVYLFHIVLACIFLGRPQSMLVVLLAVALYLACLSAERLGILTPRTIFAGQAPGPYVGFETAPLVMNLVSAVTIWLVVWYMGSRLAMMVRKRDHELARTNRRLAEAMAERSRHMLRTTHELKAPFAAVQAYAQVLLDGYCGELSEEGRRVAERIVARCRRLGEEIQEMLHLAELDSTTRPPPAPARVELPELLRGCIEQVGPLAQRRRVTVEADLQPATVVGVRNQLRLLLNNLLLNAVVYSHEGGQVRLRCASARDGQTVVTVSDDGIGIAPAKLPRIFEEHYRADEAVQHNPESSGLGLAIAARVARSHGIRLRVQSRPGRGTTFELTFHREKEPPERASG